MSFTSTIYTMGTALGLARDNRIPCKLLVDGHWMHGYVQATDGHGVVLDTDGTEHCVVRMDRISAVRMMTAAPAAASTKEIRQRCQTPS